MSKLALLVAVPALAIATSAQAEESASQPTPNASTQTAPQAGAWQQAQPTPAPTYAPPPQGSAPQPQGYAPPQQGYGPWQQQQSYGVYASPSWMQPLPPPPAMHPYSVARRTTGQVLVILGLVHGLAATIVDAAIPIYGPIVIGAPLHGTGAILCSIGAPLWMSGSKLVPTKNGIAASAPGFDVGGGVTLEPNATGATLHF